MKLELEEKVLFGIAIALISFLFLLPIIHEIGHLIFGILTGVQVIELRIDLPLFSGADYVVGIVPAGVNPTMFFLGGTTFTLIWGVIILLLYKVWKHWIIIAIGLPLTFDSIIYPFYSFFTGTGDFAEVSIEFSVLYPLISITAILLIFIYYKVV